MRWDSDSDAAMAKDRVRRNQAETARAKIFADVRDNAKRLGYSLVKHCPQCESVQACTCNR